MTLKLAGLATGVSVAVALATGTTTALFTSTAPIDGNSFTTPALAAPAATTAVASCLGAALQVTVSWTAASGVTGYAIERAPGLTGGSFATVGTVSGGATTSFVDATVAFASVYRYRVRGTVQSWTSAPSNTAIVTTPSVCL
ncbi:MAG TPA: hypothetical protein VGB83_07055 [Actinomycetota bacterium]